MKSILITNLGKIVFIKIRVTRKFWNSRLHTNICLWKQYTVICIFADNVSTVFSIFSTFKCIWFSLLIYNSKQNKKYFLLLYILGFGLVWFYGILTIVGYLMPNPFWFVETVLFQTTRLTISTQFSSLVAGIFTSVFGRKNSLKFPLSGRRFQSAIRLTTP